MKRAYNNLALVLRSVNIQRLITDVKTLRIPVKRLSFFYSATLVILIQLTTHCAQAQTINTIAGEGFMGYFGDGGPATGAAMNDPAGVAVDNSGNVYISDEANNVIRKVNTSGIISTIGGDGFGAGSFTGGYTGDGGPATAAELFVPYGMAVDASGNVYFSDAGNNVVRKINTSGIIYTIAGNGFGAGTFTGGYTGNGGPATAAELNEPGGIAVDNSGNLYITDWANNCVRKVNTAGIITTFAGDTTRGYTGDGAAATAAELNGPIGVAVDNSGNVYIADQTNNVVRKVNTSGIISTIAGTGFGAGTGIGGYTGDGGPATMAELHSPTGIALDNSGNIYISDQGNNVVRKVNTSGIISTWAGNGMAGYLGDGGPATNAELNFPTGVAVDNSGSVYIGDEGNAVVRKVGTIIGPSGLCIGATTTLTDITTGGTWSSSSTAVATINESTGLVTAVSAGVTTISYTLTGHSATLTFTVAHAPGPITGTLTICSGAETVLSDAVAGGTWSSSMPLTAFLFDPALGMVEGEAAGTTEITYATATGCSIEVLFTVLAGPMPFFGSSEICTGMPTIFSDGTPGGTWSSGSTSVATIGATTGVVTGVSAGTATIAYTLSSGCADSETIEVSTPPVAGTISGPTTVCVGSTVSLTDAAAGGYWSSTSGGLIAQVNFELGTVTGISAGIDIISYVVENSCSEAVAVISFTVDGFPDAGTVTGADSVCLGSSTTLTDVAVGGNWNSGSTTIATITSSGSVYGALNGSVDIIYTVANSCGSANTIFPITVVSDGACATRTGNMTKPEQGQLVVFPNPNDGTFSVNILSSPDEQAEIVITNVVGEKVMDFTMPVNKVVPITIQPTLGSGIYILSATTNSGKYVAKVMVE